MCVLLLGALGIGASCRNTRANGNGADASNRTDVRAAPAVTGGAAVTEVSGLDLTALSAAEKETFWAVANDELSPCGDPHSLAVCARDRLACRTCMPAMRFLAQRIQEGYGRDRLSELIHARYSDAGVVRINTEGAPSHGGAMAAVTVVEFSDYECPHCGRAVPMIRQIERDFEGRVRVVHMNFPLSGHTHAMAAAKAALAAGRQNKFWEMHDLLFTNQRALEPSDIDRYATQLGLDLNRFHTDANSPEVAAAIEATRHEGDRLQIQGTPTIYINGRLYDLNLEREPMRQWIQEELDAAH